MSEREISSQPATSTDLGLADYLTAISEAKLTVPEEGPAKITGTKLNDFLSKYGTEPCDKTTFNGITKEIGNILSNGSIMMEIPNENASNTLHLHMSGDTKSLRFLNDLQAPMYTENDHQGLIAMSTLHSLDRKSTSPLSEADYTALMMSLVQTGLRHAGSNNAIFTNPLAKVRKCVQEGYTQQQEAGQGSKEFYLNLRPVMNVARPPHVSNILKEDDVRQLRTYLESVMRDVEKTDPRPDNSNTQRKLIYYNTTSPLDDPASTGLRTRMDKADRAMMSRTSYTSDDIIRRIQKQHSELLDDEAAQWEESKKRFVRTLRFNPLDTLYKFNDQFIKGAKGKDSFVAYRTDFPALAPPEFLKEYREHMGESGLLSTGPNTGRFKGREMCRPTEYLHSNDPDVQTFINACINKRGEIDSRGYEPTPTEIATFMPKELKAKVNFILDTKDKEKVKRELGIGKDTVTVADIYGQTDPLRYAMRGIQHQFPERFPNMSREEISSLLPPRAYK
ncbi:uncharacterized protein L203_104352 [Cryptococcus depauperatus CBS 7841]|uniref:Uncharacterized protein n=1 Tax=Cryptococcus depauperatus CBS 7841 TaxID=1295531 RepID=A0A1E3IFY5_9TREE|nr:hypothetical protein L203_03287 [Cryptococcus depauperatus CBS 7841]